MNLKQYFSTHCIKINQWCKMKGLPENWVYRMMRGENISFLHAYYVMEATNFEVTPTAIFETIEKKQIEKKEKLL